MGRKYYLIIAFLLTIAITIGSLISGKNELTRHVHFSDKFVHAFAYFLLAFSWMISFKNKPEKLKISGFIAFFVLVYGIVIEALQGMFTTNRQADYYDILANFVGILLAFVFFNTFFSKKQVN